MLVAPDSFKGSLGAASAADALAAGWRSVRPDDDVRVLPQADGGEGTAEVIAATVRGTRWCDAGLVTGPDGRPVPGRWLELPDGTAVVELALTSGLLLMNALDPMGATTAGLGQVLRAAAGAGAPRAVVAVGGSASTDGGAGALVALGLRVLRGDGTAVAPGGGGLAAAAAVDRSTLVPPPRGGVEVLTDVTSVLTGPEGAAATFGPQKGADAAQVAVLDRALGRWSALLGGDPWAPGAGAAGGTAYGLATAWGARLVAGSERVGALTGLTAQAEAADVVLTGEGRFDRTSLVGKVVGHVLAVAPGALLVAGSVDPAAARSAGVRWTCALADLAGGSEGAVREPVRWLTVAGAQAARAAVALAAGRAR